MEPSDPRFSLAFVDVLNSGKFHSYVADCTFHHGYGPALGAFGVDGLELSGNTIYRTVGKGESFCVLFYSGYQAHLKC